MLDIANLLGADGDMVGNVVETLATSGDFTEDGRWAPSNAFGKHISANRRTLPTGESRIANRGVAAAKGVIGQNEDFVAFFESVSVVDDFALRKIPNGKKQEARSKYDMAHGMGLGQTMRTYSFYGDSSVDANQPDGFKTRRASSGDYCFLANGGGTKNTSLYIVGWDTLSGVHHIYPDGETMGIAMQDMGINVVLDPDNTDVVRWLPLWISWFYLDFGLVVLDDRALIRIANIDPDSTTAADYNKVFNLLNKALRIMNVPDPQVRIYGNDDALTFMDNMPLYVTNARIGSVEIDNVHYRTGFGGVPLRRVQEITSSEATVS